MHSRREYLKSLQVEYIRVRKKRKSELLTEAVNRTSLKRKYIIRVLSIKNDLDKPKIKQRKPFYTADLVAPLATIWEIFNCPCGLRLKEIIKDEIDNLRSNGTIKISDEQCYKLKKMSSKTIDTLLRKEKRGTYAQPTKATKGNPLLYKKILTKVSSDYDRDIPGFIQVDAVEHCGDSASGEYINSIACIDVASYWWEAKAIMGKGQQRTVEAINSNRKRTPFKWKEIHPDNGSNFINRLIWGYAQKTELNITRSRPYKKNDNCFAEQTNSSNIRNYVGYLRYDTEKELEILNDLYGLLSLYKNFFLPVIRLKEKTRIKGHIQRKYETPKTPYKWLLESRHLCEQDKCRLTKIYRLLNPAALKTNIDKKIQELYKTNKEKKMNPKSTKSKPVSVTFYTSKQKPFRLHF